MQLNAVIYILFSQFIQVHSYKILIYSPKIGHSHVNFFGRIADTLVEAGHEVVVLLQEFEPDVKNNGTRLARVINRKRDFEMPDSRNVFMGNVWTKKGDDFSDVLSAILTTADIQFALCESMLGDAQLMEKLRAENFDLGITEVISSCGFGIFEKIGLRKYISAFATNLLEFLTAPFGIESNPAFVPGSFSLSSDEMGYFERMTNLVMFIATKIIMTHISTSRMIAITRKHLDPDFQPGFFPQLNLPVRYTETLARSIFIIVNADEFLEFPRPVNHKVIYIGGIAVPEPMPLDMEYQKMMDAATEGAVLISFGSVAKSSLMVNETKEAFVDAFKMLPKVTFIWKYEEDDSIASELFNVVKKKWVPQNDLLAHGNMRALVSHCGLNSLTEAVHAGVPVVCIPLFGDQIRNSKTAEKRGVGVVLNKMNLNGEIIASAFKKLLYEKSFHDAALRLSKMILKKPVSVKQRLIKYVEFAAEFGVVDNTDPASRKLNFIQYYLIDIIVPFFIVLSSIIYAAIRITKWLFGRLKVFKIKTD